MDNVLILSDNKSKVTKNQHVFFFLLTQPSI